MSLYATVLAPLTPKQEVPLCTIFKINSEEFYRIPLGKTRLDYLSVIYLIISYLILVNISNEESLIQS